MDEVRSEPFLWIHAAGILAFPVLMVLCAIGVASGDPLLPVWIEETLVAGVGVLPVLLMQRYRPFYIFSALIVALPPVQLDDRRRRILAAFQTRESWILAGLSSLLSYCLLIRAYELAPLFEALSPLHRSGGVHVTGLAIAVVSFAAANLFLQVSLSATRVLFLDDADLNELEPVTAEDIATEFSIAGWMRPDLFKRWWPEVGAKPDSVGQQVSTAGKPPHSKSAASTSAASKGTAPKTAPKTAASKSAVKRSKTQSTRSTRSADRPAAKPADASQPNRERQDLPRSSKSRKSGSAKHKSRNRNSQQSQP